MIEGEGREGRVGGKRKEGGSVEIGNGGQCLSFKKPKMVKMKRESVCSVSRERVVVQWSAAPQACFLFFLTELVSFSSLRGERGRTQSILSIGEFCAQHLLSVTHSLHH